MRGLEKPKDTGIAKICSAMTKCASDLKPSFIRKDQKKSFQSQKSSIFQIRKNTFKYETKQKNTLQMVQFIPKKIT